jgi:hypothetical protein
MCPGVDSDSNNEYRDTPGGKNGRCIGVMTLPPFIVPKGTNIWSLDLLDPLRACSREHLYLYGDFRWPVYAWHINKMAAQQIELSNWNVNLVFCLQGQIMGGKSSAVVHCTNVPTSPQNTVFTWMQDKNFFFIHHLRNRGLHAKLNMFYTGMFWKSEDCGWEVISYLGE